MSKSRKREPTNISEIKSLLRTAETLIEALPYLQQFTGETFVIKYGGHAMGDAKLGQQFAKDIVLLKQVGINPVIVHGGGPQIGEMLNQMKREEQVLKLYQNATRMSDKRERERELDAKRASRVNPRGKRAIWRGTNVGV